MLLNILEQSANTVGIIGVILLLIAYYLLTVNKMSANDMSYQLLNFFGAAFIMYSLCFYWNTASALIEAAWMVISLIGVYNVLRRKKQSKVSRNNLYVINKIDPDKAVSETI